MKNKIIEFMVVSKKDFADYGHGFFYQAEPTLKKAKKSLKLMNKINPKIKLIVVRQTREVVK
jgi:hypothetical protein